MKENTARRMSQQKIQTGRLTLGWFAEMRPSHLVWSGENGKVHKDQQQQGSDSRVHIGQPAFPPSLIRLKVVCLQLVQLGLSCTIHCTKQFQRERDLFTLSALSTPPPTHPECRALLLLMDLRLVASKASTS